MFYARKENINMNSDTIYALGIIAIHIISILIPNIILVIIKKTIRHF